MSLSFSNKTLLDDALGCNPIAAHRSIVFSGAVLRTGLVCGVLAALAAPRVGWACAACYGQSDSAMAAGMNWGILSLLGMIVIVLGGVAGFFVFLARRSVALAKLHGGTGPIPEAEGVAWAAPEPQTEFSAEPSAARGALGRPSALAQQRKHCTHKQAGFTGPSSPRGLN